MKIKIGEIEENAGILNAGILDAGWKIEDREWRIEIVNCQLSIINKTTYFRWISCSLT